MTSRLFEVEKSAEDENFCSALLHTNPPSPLSLSPLYLPLHSLFSFHFSFSLSLSLHHHPPSLVPSGPVALPPPRESGNRHLLGPQTLKITSTQSRGHMHS